MTGHLTLELAAAAVLAGWVYYVIIDLSFRYYRLAISELRDDGLAKYVTRKLIHILGGGVPAALTPVIFTGPFLPVTLSFLVAAYTLLRRRFKLMAWFQEKSNYNEVTFAFMWGVSMLLSWFLTRGLLLGSLVALFLSVGDGVTGIVRAHRGERRKGWEGTLAMAIVCSVLGLVMAGAAGIASGIASSFAERVEGVDDNIVIPLAAMIILALAKAFAPWLLASPRILP
ncbi:MAG: hypothetical protein ACP5HK_06500 [Acidilobus sp.]